MAITAIAQVGINTDNSAPDPSAILDVKSSNKGFLLPRMTHVQINSIANPVNGLFVYCTDCGINGNGGFLGYNNGVWNLMTSCILPPASTSGINSPSSYDITWNWNAVEGATGYKWNSANNYSNATDMGTAISMTEFGLDCGNSYTRYVWAYNSCGVSVSAVLIQSTNSCPANCQPLTDSRDGKIYRTRLIGDQCWMKENLNVGTKINAPTYQTDNDLIEKYCYNNSESNCAIYGGLYQWDELMNYSTSSNSNPSGRQGICPYGWHIPSDAEWCQLETYLDESVNCSITGWRGTDAGGKMKSRGTIQLENGLWNTPNEGATNFSGFTALPGGNWDTPSNFSNLSIYAVFHTSTEYDPSNALRRDLLYMLKLTGKFWGNKELSCSARCVKD
jgi:uncharacterized protein (TIGR02145 family)